MRGESDGCLLFTSQVLQLNSLRPTNDAFCAILRTRLKASLPLMKALKPFSRTFFSEWFLSPERDEDVATLQKRKLEEAAVGELISFGDEKKGDSHVEVGEEWTTASGMGEGYHGGLGMIFKYPGDARK